VQCLSCGFENLPGLTACGRCASPLDLRAIGVEPPRAGRGRIRTRLHQLLIRARNAGRALRQLEITRQGPPEVRALAASLLPGLGHVLTGHRVAGLTFLVLWLAAAAAAVVHIASRRQYVFLVVMLGLHALALFTLAADSLRLMPPVRRIIGCVALSGVLGLGVYGGAGWLITGFVQPVDIGRAHLKPGLLRAEDGLLVGGRWLRPRQFERGALVMFEVRPYEGLQNRIGGGVAFDRVLGVPGDAVAIDGSRVLVNDRPPPRDRGPLSTLPPSDGLPRRVLGPREYFIIPSQVGILAHNAVLHHSAMEQLTVIPYENIRGRVWWRVRPPERWGPLE